MTEPKRPNSLVLNEALLMDFVDGKLQPAIEEKVAKHLEARPELLQKIVSKSGDGFLQKLRDVQQRSKADSPAVVKAEMVQAVAVDKKPSGKELSIPPQLANYTAYQVTKELGRGGMGVVYLAKNVQMDRFEVLKVLNERLLDHEGAKERFLREIRAVSKLNHPNIVTSYSILPLDNLMVFAMEYIHGVDLLKYIHRNTPLPIWQACAFAKQIAAGLQHAHEKKLVHRDIKPSNVIVYKSDGQLQLKILDFGLAKASSEEAAMAAGLTQDGTMLGTPEYMSPEQTLNAAKADIRADIYSLGCTLYHMLAGKPPFSGTHGAVLMAHAQREATSLNLVRPEVPVELATVVTKMIAKDANKRFQTPAEVTKALNPFLEQTQTAGKKSTTKEVGSSNTVNDLKGPDRDTSVEGPVPELSLESASQLDSPAEERFAATANRPKRPASIHPSRKLHRVNPKTSKPRWFLPTAIAGGGLLLAFAIVMLGVFIFRTPEGTIVVENMPSDAEVMVDGKKMSITWNAGRDKAEVSIDPGSHQLQVLNQGNEIYGDKVTVKGGDSALVKLAAETPNRGSGLPKVNIASNSHSDSMTQSRNVTNAINLIPNDATQFNGKHYKVFFESYSWNGASEACRKMGGNLVQVNNEIENSFLCELVRKFSPSLNEVWLGATDEKKEGEWLWGSGRKLNFAKWGVGQPNNKGSGENYLMLIVRYPNNPERNETWSDQPDNAESKHRPGFICEWTGSTSAQDVSDPFTVGSIWTDVKKSNQLTVLSRNGQNFSAKFIVGPGIERVVNGTCANGKVSWYASDVQAIRGAKGADNFGTLIKDGNECRINFTWGNGGKTSPREGGTFVLILQPPNESVPRELAPLGSKWSGTRIDSGKETKCEGEIVERTKESLVFASKSISSDFVIRWTLRNEKAGLVLTEVAHGRPGQTVSVVGGTGKLTEDALEFSYETQDFRDGNRVGQGSGAFRLTVVPKEIKGNFSDAKQNLRTSLGSMLADAKVRFVRGEEFNNPRPFRKLNETYVENGAQSIKSNRGLWGYNFGKLGENQYCNVSLRVRGAKTGSVGVSLTPLPPGKGAGIWIDGGGKVTIGASLFAPDDVKKKTNVTHHGPPYENPMDSWNELVLLRRQEKLFVYVNAKLIDTLDIQAKSTETVALSFTSHSQADNTIVDMDSFEIFELY